MDIKQMIGARIATIRAKRGMTQEDLAVKVGIGPKYLSSIERGKENPTLNTLINLSNALGVDLGDIFTCVERRSKQEKILCPFYLGEGGR